MAVFHPLKHTHTHAGSQGKRDCREERQTEETVGGVLLLKTHSSLSHPRLGVSLSAGADRERSENRLRLFAAARFFLFFIFFFPSPPLTPPPPCPRAHISLYHARNRLGEIETAHRGHGEDITQAASDRRLAVSFCRSLN